MPVEEAPASARELEAGGAQTTQFSFRGTPVTIPLQIERWPLDAIRASRPSRAVRQLLGDARPAMSTRADVIELSNRMADAVGITPLPEDRTIRWFGAIPMLLGVVDNHGDDIEADLLRFFGVDYRLPAAAGGPTLRQVWIYIRRLPVESALMASRNKGDPPWTRHEILLAKLWEMFTQKRYPNRPPTREEVEEFLADQQQKAAELAKLKDRERYYASGQNMRDAGVEPGPRPPKQPPRPQPANPANPVEAALAVAKRNARRSLTVGAPDGRPAAPGRYDPAGSGWG